MKKKQQNCNYTMRISEDLKNRLYTYSNKVNLNISDIIRKAVIEYMEKHV